MINIGGRLGGDQVRTVAKHFKRDPPVISRGITKVENKGREEEAFDSRVSRLKEAKKEIRRQE